MGNDDQIWLESNGVWARLPQREPKRSNTRNNNAPNKRRKHEFSREHASSPKSSLDNNGDGNEDELEEAGSLCCSICLDEVSTHHKAVITPCMHEYHHTCISKWLSMKQDCPLCKSNVMSVLYNIQEDGSFLERELNLPLKHVTNREDIMRRLAEILGQGLDELVRYQVGRRDEQWRNQRENHTTRNLSSFSQQQQQQRHPRNSDRSSDRITGVALPSAYSMHVEHHANVSSRARQRRTPTPAPPFQFQHHHNLIRGRDELGEEEALIAWRREIYDLDVWAIPLGTHHHVPRSLVAPAGRQNRIREWVHRELQALLETEHTTILRGFVMGLLATYGAHPPLPPSRLPPAEILAINNATTTEAEGPGDNPVSQLRQFLGSAAEHFWHELSCFATAPAYTIRTYDNLVRYARPGEPVVLQMRHDNEEEDSTRRKREGGRREDARGRERERDDAHRKNFRRQRSYSRFRSRIRSSNLSDKDYHNIKRRRRRHEEKEQTQEDYRTRRSVQMERGERQEEVEQTEDFRWQLWTWGDPVYE